jgi:hypothetical protein
MSAFTAPSVSVPAGEASDGVLAFLVGAAVVVDGRLAKMVTVAISDFPAIPVNRV